MDAVRDPLELDPDRVIGVSGGALSAAAFLSRRGETTLRVMQQAFADLDENLAMDPDGAGLSPHQRIYRRIAGRVVDARAQARIALGPHFEIAIGRLPEAAPDWLSDRITGMLAAILYEGELHLKSRPHMEWAPGIGLRAERVDARAAAASGRLADLVSVAATIPPVFTPPLWDGAPAVDGGMVDQAPMPEPDEGATLVLLTRDYDDLPDIPGRDYVRPSADVPADKIDFTDPEKIAETWEMGQADGRRFLARKGNPTS